jgi:hypothetical protein
VSRAADERSRILGGALALGAIIAGLLFLYGVLRGSYLALALPVAAVTLFVLGLVAWIGWTIATVQVEADESPPPAPPPPEDGPGGPESGGPGPVAR